jgi:hypothetical protein
VGLTLATEGTVLSDHLDRVSGQYPRGRAVFTWMIVVAM